MTSPRRVPLRAAALVIAVAAVVAATALVLALAGSGSPTPPAATGGVAGEPTPTPTPTPAEDAVNLWVDPDGGTCRRGSAPAAYADDAACGTLDAAFQAAEAGDVVVLGCDREVCDFGGEPQTIRGAGRSSSAHVTFRPASGRRILTGDVRFQGAADEGAVAPEHITLDGEDRWTLGDDFYVYPGAADITVRDVSAAKFYIRCGFDVTVEGSEFTDRTATGVPAISSPFGQAVPPGEADVCSAGVPARDVTLRGNHFHEIWKPVGCPNAECHRECLHVEGVDGLVIEGNRFEKCLGSTAAISFNIHDDSTIRRVQVVDNDFRETYEDIDDAGCPGPADCPERVGTGSKLSIHFSATSSSGCEAEIRRNTFATGGRHISAECPERGAGVVVEANTFDIAPGCEAEADGYTWRDNLARSGVWEPDCDDGGNRIGAAG